MSFTEAIQSGFRNYANFAGRAMRSEYWYWVLFAILASLAAIVVDVAVTVFLASVIVGLGLLIPGLAVGVRRLHDIDKSGWNLLWGLVPFFGGLYLLYLYVQPGTPGPNKYGPPASSVAPATRS